MKSANHSKSDIALEDLEIEPSDLRHVSENIIHAQRKATDNHPNNFKGTIMWHDGVKSLRDQLIPKGWIRIPEVHAGGKSLTVNSDRSIAIDVSAGNQFVGTNAEPSTKNTKGSSTEFLISANQGELFEINEDSCIDMTETDGVQTWMFLYFFDLKKQELRTELSLPDKMVNHVVKGWRERIILEPISLVNQAVPEEHKKETVFTSGFDVEISLKDETGV